ncbi:hypothetical protein BDR22DRAFT_819045 [Usnea florida]
MEREFRELSLDKIDVGVDPTHICGTRITQEMEQPSPLEEDETISHLSKGSRLDRSHLVPTPSFHNRGPTSVPVERTFNPLTETATLLSNLPLDILFTIAEHCGRQDLLRFCLASQRTMQASIPHIYRQVDLSTHNRGVVVCPRKELGNELGKSTLGPRRVRSDSIRCTNVPVNMVLRQWVFIKTMLNRKEYRKYVQVLIWTFLPPTGGGRDFCAEKQIVWDLMRRLENVRSFDLADLSETWSSESPQPSTLEGRYFPNASSIRLVGVMEPVITSSILSTIDPSRLVSLELDNVQCCGKTAIGVAMPSTPNMPPSSHNVAAIQPRYKEWMSSDSGIVWPGLMGGLLSPLKGRCTGLKSLTLRKVGDRYLRESDVVRWMNECHLLHEWASFIGSVSGTLEEFMFDQGPRNEKLCREYVRVNPVRLMDRLFGSIIFPVLLAGPWPRLKSMELRGVRSWIGHDMGPPRVNIRVQYEGLPFVISLEDQLKVAVKQGARVVVQGKGRTFDLVGGTGRWKKPVSSFAKEDAWLKRILSQQSASTCYHGWDNLP